MIDLLVIIVNEFCNYVNKFEDFYKEFNAKNHENLTVLLIFESQGKFQKVACSSIEIVDDFPKFNKFTQGFEETEILVWIEEALKFRQLTGLSADSVEYFYDKAGNYRKYTWPNGIIYEGTWMSDKPNGVGKYTCPDGRIYKGELVDGNLEGKGKFIWPDGRVYEGNWLQGKRAGKGKMTWPDGSIYEGDWLDGKMTGKGKYTFASGGIYEGDFTDNQYNGKGKFIYLDGEIYEGFYQNNKRQGTGILITVDGKCYSQIYSQDKLLKSRDLGFCNRSEVCPCGSGKMYKNCHERRL